MYSYKFSAPLCSQRQWLANCHRAIPGKDMIWIKKGFIKSKSLPWIHIRRRPPWMSSENRKKINTKFKFNKFYVIYINTSLSRSDVRPVGAMLYKRCAGTGDRASSVPIRQILLTVAIHQCEGGLSRLIALHLLFSCLLRLAAKLIYLFVRGSRHLTLSDCKWQLL